MSIMKNNDDQYDSRPRFIVVLGVWLIFGVQIPFLALFLTMILVGYLTQGYTIDFGNGSSMSIGAQSLSGLITYVIILGGVLWIYVMIVTKVTCRYRRQMKQYQAENKME